MSAFALLEFVPLQVNNKTTQRAGAHSGPSLGSLGSAHWAATLNRTTNAVTFFPYLPSHDGFKAYGKQHFNVSSLLS